MIQVAAPCNLFAHGNKADALRCGHLIARVQNGFQSSVFNVDFSLNHGHARPFGTGIHGKDRSGDGYQAIRSTNVQVSGVTLRGFDDDATLVEMDRCVATAGADRQFCTLIHFHFRALEEPHLGMGIGGRANEFTLADFVPCFQCALASGANAIRLPFDGIDPCAVARRAREVPVVPSPDQGNQQGHCCCRAGQSDNTPLETA